MYDAQQKAAQHNIVLYRYTEFCYTDCHILEEVLLKAVILSVFMLIAVMLIVVGANKSIADKGRTIQFNRGQCNTNFSSVTYSHSKMN
jgi:hypothetical protein